MCLDDRKLLTFGISWRDIPLEGGLWRTGTLEMFETKPGIKGYSTGRETRATADRVQKTRPSTRKAPSGRAMQQRQITGQNHSIPARRLGWCFPRNWPLDMEASTHDLERDTT